MNIQKPSENSLSDTDKDFALWWLLLQARRAMHKVRSRELLKYGVTPEESAILLVVKTIGDAATPAEISRWILREPHSTSGLLERMRKKGLIDKTKDLDRKNLVRVVLTDKGQESLQESSGRESVHKILSYLSLEERQQLTSLVIKLRKAAIEELGTFGVPPFPKI
ncbi:MAG: MarR family winged helix-turn-helix transcriptional regulator [Chloroflexi bacterium]|nr:MarR family winged helix-turn-helix transcriptional regulator [Chloroflexota bacterium]